MIDRFSSTGATDGAMKWPKVFRYPMARARRLTKKMLGNMIRRRSTVRENRSGVAENPGANSRVSGDGKSTPTAVSRTRNRTAKVTITRLASTASLRPRVARQPETTGTNPADRAPSAVRRRNRFGIRKATKNASAALCAPRR